MLRGQDCRGRGFTALEAVISLAIFSILAALAWWSVAQMRPRSNLLGSANELAALLRNARQNALTTGHPTVVMVFPDQASSRGGQGRIVVYEDGSAAADFFTAGGSPNFDGFSATRSVVAGENLLGELELPPGMSVSLGNATAPTLVAPYASVTASSCSFCATGGDHRGAIAFDSRGRARFYSANGAALSAGGHTVGGTLSIGAAAEISGYRMLLITATTGSVRLINQG